MMNYKTTTIRDLIADAQSRGTEAWNTLQELVSATTVDKDGKEYGLSFLTIKKTYFQKFCPELLPKKKAKKPSMRELVAAL